MTLAVVWTDRASRDLDKALDFVRQRSPQAASRLLDRIESRTGRLADFPASGRKVPERPDAQPPLREVIVSGYRVVYAAYDDRVEVLTLFHARRRFPFLA